MLKKDLEKMSFEELINLQKSLNETIVKKRNNDIGDLIRELKILNKKRNDLSKKIEKLEAIICLENLNDILNRNHNSYCYFNNEVDLVIYHNKNMENQSRKRMTINIEEMTIVNDEGYEDEVVNGILTIVNGVINGAKNEE